MSKPMTVSDKNPKKKKNIFQIDVIFKNYQMIPSVFFKEIFKF